LHMVRAATLLGVIALLGVVAACPNACSGNGICGANDKCSCHQNWQGADCSLRTCPFTVAWVDTPDGTNQAHYYAECGNKGTCDRKTGECSCFDGYEGKGCRRSTCPEDCSGHGTCEYIEELGRDWADRRNGPGYLAKDNTCEDRNTCSATAEALTNVVAQTDNTDVYSGYRYELWDAHKIQGCKCDLGYKGSDCSQREVPRGDDPLTTVKSDSQEQFIQLTGVTQSCSSDSDCDTDGAKCVSAACTMFGDNDEIFMKFHDHYGGVWTTGSIPLTPGASNAATTGTNDADEELAARVQTELRSLPNGVLSDIVVTHVPAATSVNLCTRQYDGVQHISAYDETTDGNYKNSKGATNVCSVTATSGAAYTDGFTQTFTATTAKVDLLVRMGDSPGQSGVQYLFEVHTQRQSDGSFPTSLGAAYNPTSKVSASVSVNEANTNVGSDTNIDMISELSACSDRGLDDGEGQCECFDGYRGLACEEQEALV